MPQLNATPWPDILDLLEYWSRNPPLNVLAKRAFYAWFQIEDEDPEDPGDAEHKVMTEQELDGWINSLQR